MLIPRKKKMGWDTFTAGFFATLAPVVLGLVAAFFAAGYILG
jgi:hypothetical protein